MLKKVPKLVIVNLKSIKARMIFFFSSLLVLSITLFGLIDYYNFSTTYLNNSITYASAVASQMTINLDTYLREAEDSIKVLAVNEQVISSIRDYSSNTDYVNKKNRDSLVSMANNIIAQKPDISNIIIYSNGTIYNRDFNFSSKKVNMAFLQKIQDENQNNPTASVKLFKTYIAMDFGSGSDSIAYRISAAFPIKDISNINKPNLGYIFCDFNMSRIEEMFNASKLGSNTVALITDVSGNVIYSNNEGYFNSFDWGTLSRAYAGSSGAFMAKNGKTNMLVTYSTSQISSWKVVFLTNMAEFGKSSKETGFFTIFLIVIAILITVFISTFLSVKNTAPLIRLARHMRLVAQGNLDIRISEKEGGYEEIATLNTGFNTMMDQINQLIKEVYQSRLKQHEAEFEALQAKINPHFLYNTLQTINSLAVLERTSEIEQVATSLGNLLEYLVYEQNEMVNIHKEIDYIRNYLEIQSKRYNNSFRVVMDIEENVYSCLIPKLILQPIIENAILHGLDSSRENGLLSISGKIAQDKVVFEIADNGAGMGAATLERLRNRLDTVNDENLAKSIGLINVQERIRIKFGSLFGIQIDSATGEGTKVTLTIPVLKEKQAGSSGT